MRVLARNSQCSFTLRIPFNVFFQLALSRRDFHLFPVCPCLVWVNGRTSLIDLRFNEQQLLVSSCSSVFSSCPKTQTTIFRTSSYLCHILLIRLGCFEIQAFWACNTHLHMSIYRYCVTFKPWSLYYPPAWMLKWIIKTYILPIYGTEQQTKT